MDLLGTARDLFSLLWGVLGCMLRFLWLSVLPKAVLVAKLMALEARLASCLDAVNRKKAPKPRFSQAFRWVWVFVVVFTPTATMTEPERKAVGAESLEVSTTCVVRGGGVEHLPPPSINDLRTAPIVARKRGPMPANPRSRKGLRRFRAA